MVEGLENHFVLDKTKALLFEQLGIVLDAQQEALMQATK